MDIYSYEYDTLSKQTIRSLSGHVPDISDIPNILSSKVAPNQKIATLKLIYATLADVPNIDLEDRWWACQDTIQVSEATLTKIKNLSNLSSVDSLGAEIPYTNSELQHNKEELDALLLDTGYQTVAALEASLVDAIASAKDARTGVEAVPPKVVAKGTAQQAASDPGNSWLLAYRGVSTTVKRPVYTGTIPKAILKQLIATHIDSEVRNPSDTLADLAKMNSLLFSMVAAIYSTLTPTAMSKIPAVDKAVIDYSMARFRAVQTRGDRQLATEGTKLIDKLFDREVAIADIVDLLINKG